MLNPSVFEVDGFFDDSDLSTEAKANWSVKRKKKLNRTGTVHLRVEEIRDTKSIDNSWLRQIARIYIRKRKRIA